MTTTNHTLTLNRFKPRRAQRPRFRGLRRTTTGRRDWAAVASPSEQVLRDLPHVHSLHR